MPTPTERAVCPVCHRTVAAERGRFVEHDTPRTYDHVPELCAGSGERVPRD